MTLMVQASSGAVESLTTVPVALRLENAVVSYIGYLAATFWPSGLTVFYPYPATLPAWQPITAACAILGISAAVFALRQRRYLAVGWLWYLGTLVPVIGFVQVGSQSHADRYMYVPLVGLAVMLAWGTTDLLQKWPRAQLTIAVAVCAACVPLTWAQAGYWLNSETLFQRALAVTSGNALAEHNLGSYLLDQPGRVPEALSHLQAAVQLAPASASIHSDLGTALAKSGRPVDAIAELQESLRLGPDSAIVRNNLGSALLEAGRVPEAVAEYRNALRLDPNYADARKNLDAALRAPEPDSAEAHYNLGVDLAHAGRVAEAAAQFEAALRLQPNYAEAHNNLGVALSQIPARAAEALAHFQTAVRLHPDDAGAHVNLGVALAAMPGRLPDAIAQLEAAYRLQPDPELRTTLERLRTGR
jgi:tetratricopeptide (TPR) repeat protein